jgi:hypothetical protein
VSRWDYPPIPGTLYEGWGDGSEVGYPHTVDQRIRGRARRVEQGDRPIPLTLQLAFTELNGLEAKHLDFTPST